MKKKFTYLFILMLSLSSHSQHKEKLIELPELEIVDQNFTKIIRFVNDYETICDYYDENLIFIVDIQTINNYSRLKINTEVDSNLALDRKPIGFFHFEEHLYLILNDIPKDLFNKKKHKKEFSYLKYDFFYEEFDSEGRRILRLIIDDSHSEWVFGYFQNEFIFEDFQKCSE